MKNMRIGGGTYTPSK